MTEQISVYGRICYADIFQPSRFKTFDGQDQWSCRILIPKTDKKTLLILRDAILESKRAASQFGDQLKFQGAKVIGIRSDDHQPIKDGDLVNQEDHKGHFYIQAKSKSQPPSVNQRLEPIMTADDLYSGCYANVGIGVKVYGSPVAGIGWFLNGLQLVKHGPKIAGGPSIGDMFNPIDVPPEDVGANSEGDPFDEEGGFDQTSADDGKGGIDPFA